MNIDICQYKIKLLANLIIIIMTV